MAEQTRTPATPGEGAARGFVRVILAGAVTAGLQYLGVIDLAAPGLVDAIVGLLMLTVALPALEAWGKYLREHEINALFTVAAIALLLTGCGVTLKPPTLIFGDAYYWRCGGQVSQDENGEPRCDKDLTELRGGKLSEQGARALEAAVALPRTAAAAAIGAP